MRKIVCLLLLIVSFQSFGQNQEYFDLISEYKNDLITQNQNDSLKSLTLVRLSILFRKTHQLDSSLYYARIAKDFAKEKKQYMHLGNAYLSEAIGYFRKTEYKKGKILADSAVYILKKYGDKPGLAAAYLNIGNMFFQENNLEYALNYYLEALELSKETKRTDHQMGVSYNMALIYFQLNSFQKSISYLDDMLQMSLENDFHVYDAYIHHLRGSNYFKLNNLSNAKDNYLTALNIAEKNEDVRLQILAKIDLGELSLLQKNIAKAKTYYTSAIQLLDSLDSEIEEISAAYIGLADVYLREKNIDNAIAYVTKGYSFAIKQKQTEFERDAYNLLADIYEFKGEYKEAYKYELLSRQLADSISNTEITKNITDLETKYQTQQKENEILQLTNENNEKKAALAQSRLLNFSGAGLLLLLSGIGFFFWQRKKQELKIALLENSIQASELEKKRIGKELHDGIAGTLIKLVKDVEQKDMQLSDKLLSTYNEVRTLSHQLDNTPMHGEAFMDRMIDLIPQNEGDRQFSFKITPLSLELKEPIGTHLYRIIQELIANNLKHAKASLTKIHISLEDNILNLHYEDNGVGIKNLKKGNGFNNMEHRLELIKGKLHISTDLPEGLQIQIDIPYTHE